MTKGETSSKLTSSGVLVLVLTGKGDADYVIESLSALCIEACTTHLFTIQRYEAFSRKNSQVQENISDSYRCSCCKVPARTSNFDIDSGDKPN